MTTGHPAISQDNAKQQTNTPITNTSLSPLPWSFVVCETNLGIPGGWNQLNQEPMHTVNLVMPKQNISTSHIISTPTRIRGYSTLQL